MQFQYDRRTAVHRTLQLLKEQIAPMLKHPDSVTKYQEYVQMYEQLNEDWKVHTCHSLYANDIC